MAGMQDHTYLHCEASNFPHLFYCFEEKHTDFIFEIYSEYLLNWQKIKLDMFFKKLHWSFPKIKYSVVGSPRHRRTEIRGFTLWLLICFMVEEFSLKKKKKKSGYLKMKRVTNCLYPCKACILIKSSHIKHFECTKNFRINL